MTMDYRRYAPDPELRSEVEHLVVAPAPPTTLGAVLVPNGHSGPPDLRDPKLSLLMTDG